MDNVIVEMYYEFMLDTNKYTMNLVTRTGFNYYSHLCECTKHRIVKIPGFASILVKAGLNLLKL